MPVRLAMFVLFQANRDGVADDKPCTKHIKTADVEEHLLPNNIDIYTMKQAWSMKEAPRKL